MHQLAASFILGYHGCDKAVGERILEGEPFKQSNNDYDWLGPGIYFWEANPLRGLDFAREAKKRRSSNIKKPFVIGAVISLGLCLDLTTTAGIEQVRAAHKSLVEFAAAAGRKLPENAVWSKYSSFGAWRVVSPQPLSSWPILDQKRNKLTSARAANAIITAGFPNACQNPCPMPDGCAHSLTPTPNRMKFTQASQ